LTPERLLTIRMLSTLPSTTISRANANWTACVLRLYHPETRSIVLLNQISSWVLSCSILCPASSRSTRNVTCREVGSFSIPAFKSSRVLLPAGVTGETMSSNAKANVREGMYDGFLPLAESVLNQRMSVKTTNQSRRRRIL